tara:strand:- start:3351 stop:3821 length:471 start_codon:yes stop_codon:yes gene_type:complete
MVRQTYENNLDREREVNFQKWMKSNHNIDLYKLPIKYSVDFLAEVNEKPVGWIELRWRRHKHGVYKEFMIAQYKIKKMIDLYESTSIPSYLYIRHNDCISYIEVRRHHAIGNNSLGKSAVRWGGMNNMRDDQDREPCVYIPIDNFMKMEGIVGDQE